MPAPVKLYSELIIKVSFPSCTPPHPSLQYSKYCCGEEEEVGGSWIPQVGQDQNKEGCSVETELVRVWRGEAGSLMPGVDGCFCLVVRGGGGASERLSNWQQLSGEKDKRTPRCQLKFKHSFAMNFMAGGWEGGGANARAESCQCASPPPSSSCHTGRSWSNMTAAEGFIFCMVTLASVFAL